MGPFSFWRVNLKKTQEVIFTRLFIIFASFWRLAGAISKSKKRIAQGGVNSVRRMSMKFRDFLSVDDKRKLNASAAKMSSFAEKIGKRLWELVETHIKK